MSMYFGPGPIKWDDAALDHMLNNPKGEVGRHLRKIGLEVLGGARAIAGVRTGQLKRKLYIRQATRARYQFVEVGSTASHAYVHHEGSKPHEIKGGVGRLIRYNVGGKVVYAHKVNHPGTKGRKYLTIPMERAVKR